MDSQMIRIEGSTSCRDVARAGQKLAGSSNPRRIISELATLPWSKLSSILLDYYDTDVTMIKTISRLYMSTGLRKTQSDLRLHNASA